MKKIGVVTGTRAEYGLLKPIIEKIVDDKDLDLYLIVTGMHLEEAFGNTYKFIENDGYKISYKIPMNLTDNTAKGVVLSMATELEGFSSCLKDAQLDMIVLLGDRYETLIAATAAIMYQIPIAHIHGGEVTEGAVDDAIRHAITKMSSLHFTTTQMYAKRVCQMGETPSNIFCTGAPGVENIHKMKVFSREELVENYGELFENPYMMVTYHPVTLENNTVTTQFQNLLNVLKNNKQYNYCFTYANSDVDGMKVNKMIEEFVEENNNVCAFISMGQKGYLSALKYCRGVIGNSSSGIIEAPSFRVPTLNIGNRQKGRIRAESVVDCGYEEAEIKAGFDKIISSTHLKKCEMVINPYYAEDTSSRVVEEIKRFMEQGAKVTKKFYDIDF